MALMSDLHRALVGTQSGWSNEKNPLQILGISLELIHTLQRFRADEAQIYEAISKFVTRSYLPLIHTDKLTGLGELSEGLDKELLEAVQFLKVEDQLNWAILDLKDRHSERQNESNLQRRRIRELEREREILLQRLKVLPDIQKLQVELGDRESRMEFLNTEVFEEKTKVGKLRREVEMLQQLLEVSGEQGYLKLHRNKRTQNYFLPHEASELFGIRVTFHPSVTQPVAPDCHEADMARQRREKREEQLAAGTLDKEKARLAQLRWENGLVKKGFLVLSPSDVLSLINAQRHLVSLFWDKTVGYNTFLQKSRNDCMSPVSFDPWLSIDEDLQLFHKGLEKVMKLIKSRVSSFSAVSVTPYRYQLNRGVILPEAESYVMGSMALKKLHEVNSENWPMVQISRDDYINYFKSILTPETFLVTRRVQTAGDGTGGQATLMESYRKAKRKALLWPEGLEKPEVHSYILGIR